MSPTFGHCKLTYTLTVVSVANKEIEMSSQTPQETGSSGAPERMGAKGNIIKTSTLFKNINKTLMIYQKNINKLLT